MVDSPAQPRLKLCPSQDNSKPALQLCFDALARLPDRKRAKKPMNLACTAYLQLLGKLHTLLFLYKAVCAKDLVESSARNRGAGSSWSPYDEYQLAEKVRRRECVKSKGGDFCSWRVDGQHELSKLSARWLSLVRKAVGFNWRLSLPVLSRTIVVHCLSVTEAIWRLRRQACTAQYSGSSNCACTMTATFCNRPLRSAAVDDFCLCQCYSKCI